MGDAIGADAFAGAVGEEAEHVLAVQIVGIDRHVPGIGIHGRSGAPQQEALDPALVGDEIDPEVGTEGPQLSGRFQPAFCRDQEVALRRRRQLVGMPIAVGRRALLRRCCHQCNAPTHGAAERLEERRSVSERRASATMKVHESLNALTTPALIVDGDVLEHNLTAMAMALPGARCRPHIKAHKTTELARRQRAIGHVGFTCATTREMVGLAAAGLGDDLLLANEVVDAEILTTLANLDARVTIAVDSEHTIEAAARAGLKECLIDVNVGLPRCGCLPDDAGHLADLARARGLEVRGVMGYEGHVVGLTDRVEREHQTAECMAQLARAHLGVGGDVISAGGTGTFDCNHFATEIQAGSYALMDTTYRALDIPFRPALSILATIVSVNARNGYAVADCGLKSLGMDHGNPSIDGATVWFCSDEHTTFSTDDGSTDNGAPLPEVGTRVQVWPAHVDPTVAYHERMHVVEGGAIVDTWAVDLRGW